MLPSIDLFENLKLIWNKTFKVFACIAYYQNATWNSLFECNARNCNALILTSSHRMLYKPAISCWDGRSVSVYTRIPIFVCFARRLVNMPHVACHTWRATHGVPSWRAIMACHHGVPSWRAIMACHHGVPSWRAIMACHHGVHAIVSRSPWGHGWVAPDKRHYKPNPFIQDLCLWRTSQELVKTDLYPLSQGLWSLSGMPSVRPGAGR